MREIEASFEIAAEASRKERCPNHPPKAVQALANNFQLVKSGSLSRRYSA
jgi:hypothetical protein